MMLFFLCLLADPKDEIRRLLPEAASLPEMEWQALQKKASTPDDMSRRGLFTLTFAVLSMRLDADADLDLAREAGVTSAILRQAIGRNVVTCLQKEYIKDLTCAVDGDAANGSITAEIPKVGRLVALYSARRQGTLWQIVEFRLPKAGIVCASDGQAWRRQWATPRAQTLSLVYSFGAVTCFGRKVFDLNEVKWGELEKIFAERADVRDGALLLTGEGTGWNWALLREILARAKNAGRIRFRSFEIAPGASGKVLHLCSARDAVSFHGVDAKKHDEAVSKAAKLATFGDETIVWADDTGNPLVLHHPMSDDALLSADRKATALFARRFGEGPILLDPDPHVSCEHLIQLGAALAKAGVKEIHLK